MEAKVLVLDGNQRAALAAARSLGAKGLWLAVGESTSKSLAGASRFCRQTILYPDPYSSPRLFFETVLSKIKEHKISFLLPISEATTYVILKYRDELPTNVTLPFPDAAAVEKIANKNNLFHFAQQNAIPVPDTTYCNNTEEGIKALEKIDHYPIVLKPAKSRFLLADQIISTQVFTAHSRDHARDILSEHSFFDFPFTIQSFIEGEGQGVFALFNQGEPVCYFSHRRLREKPPTGGVSVLSESAPMSEPLQASAENLLRLVKWHGVAMVEYRVTSDGTGFLMEVNPRFWGSLQLAIDSGIDFPWWLYLINTGRQVPKTDYKRRRLRWLLGDLDRLLIILKAPLGTYSVSKKLIEMARFFKPGMRTRHEVNRCSDPKPFLFELKQYLRALRG